jgi:UDP-2,3-diacylglucosamine pyrophosphatase LpxH
MDHDQFLERLLALFPGQVFLVGRYADPNLRLGDDGVLRFFLPDFHWMSRDRADHYTGGYRFNGNTLLPGGPPVFATFLEALEAAAAAGDGSVEVFQLGDSYDLWRERRDADEPLEAAFRRIYYDAGLNGLIERLKALNVRLILGNHDYGLKGLPDTYPESKAPETDFAAQDRIILVHGHRYDVVEGLPESLKAWGVRSAPNVKARSQDIGLFARKDIKDLEDFIKLRNRRNDPVSFPYPSIRPRGAFLIAAPSDLAEIEKSYQAYLDVSPFSKQSGLRNDFEHASYLEFADQIYVEEINHPGVHGVHAIGHTHRARILIDRLPDGSRHVILDCGGWIERCSVLARPQGRPYYVPSAQFAVQYGDELRIYQLGGNY